LAQLKLHLDAFRYKTEGGKREPVIDPAALKCWYLARYWDPEGTGACRWDDAAAAEVLRVKPTTVRAYRRRAVELGLFIVSAAQADGSVYVRYLSALRAAEQFGFRPDVLIAVDLGVLRWTYARTAVHLHTYYGQRRSYYAQRTQERARQRRHRRELPEPESLVDDDRRSYSSPINRFRRLEKTPAGRFYHRGEWLQLYQVELADRRGNTVVTRLGTRHSKAAARRYSYVWGATTATYGVGQEWVARRLGITQEQVSRHLRRLPHVQVREVVADPASAWEHLVGSESFNPERPWCTVIPYEGEVDEGLLPGIYTLERLGRSNGYVLTRTTCNVYQFPGWYLARARLRTAAGYRARHHAQTLKAKAARKRAAQRPRNVTHNVPSNATSETAKNAANNVNRNVNGNVSCNASCNVSGNVNCNVINSVSNNVTNNVANNVTSNVGRNGRSGVCDYGVNNKVCNPRQPTGYSGKASRSRRSKQANERFVLTGIAAVYGFNGSAVTAAATATQPPRGGRGAK